MSDVRYEIGETILDRLRAIERRLALLEALRSDGILGTDQTIKASHDRLDSLLGADKSAPDGTLVSNFNADMVDGFHASATATANTLLALNSSAKLPASITGDADTLDGYHAEDFEMGVAPDKMVSGYTSDITGTSDTTVISAPGSGYRLYITQLTVINSHSTTGTWVNIKSGSTTVYTVYAAPGGGGVSITFRSPLRLGSNEALVAACATSGANVRVSACGYKDTV